MTDPTDPADHERRHKELTDLLLEHLHQALVERDNVRQQLLDLAHRAAAAIEAATHTIDELKADRTAHRHTISDLKTELDYLKAASR